MTFDIEAEIRRATRAYFSPARATALCDAIPRIAARSYVLAEREEREEMTRRYIAAVREIDALAVQLAEGRVDREA